VYLGSFVTLDVEDALKKGIFRDSHPIGPDPFIADLEGHVIAVFWKDIPAGFKNLESRMHLDFISRLAGLLELSCQ